VVGIVSTSYEAADLRGPTFVSLIWPAIVSEVAAPWPSDFWPDSVASKETAKKLGCGRLHGTATFSIGVFDIEVSIPQGKSVAVRARSFISLDACYWQASPLTGFGRLG
jgi:hypothetical protein